VNQNIRYGIVFLFLGIIAIISIWQKSAEDKYFIEEKKIAPKPQNYQLLAQKKRDIVPPVDPTRSIVRETKEQREVRLENLLKKALNSPVNFWGRVVDEKGNPISGARAEISVTDNFSWNPTAKNTRTEYVRKSDTNGLFSLLEKKGGSLHVNMYAEGYVPSLDKKTNRKLSCVSLSYSDKNDGMYFQNPTEVNPILFILRKKNSIANLALAFKDCVSISKLGESQRIELKTKEKVSEFVVRCWSSCPVPFTYDRYDWRAEIHITGGKLQAITEFEPFLAPTEGYQRAFKVEMPKDTRENWLRSSPNGNRDFWVQFDDGTYGKARIEVKTGREHEVDAEIWYNLDGTNNFEQ
jgi:hypothetical protein